MNTNVSTFVALGKKLSEYVDSEGKNPEFESFLNKVNQSNGWFDPQQVKSAIRSWSLALSRSNVERWLQNVSFTITSPKTIGLIVAGNIPLVGMHDLLCLWASPHHARIKCAAKDPLLLPWIVSELERISPSDQGRIQFVEGALKDYEAVIATGSNNSARYFESYFSKVPHLIRKNRNGIAILDGTETKEQLEALGDDILRYYGLGCRSVSKIYLPEGYNLDLVFGGLYPHRSVMEAQKYANNYDYNKAVYLMSEYKFLENGFFLLRESTDWAAPIACLNYTFYKHLDDVKEAIATHSNSIQCIVSHCDVATAFSFGLAQEPQLWDYADGVNTLSFLSQL